MGVRVEVRLRDAISRALHYDSDAVDPKGLVFEESPRDTPRPNIPAGSNDGGKCRYQSDCQNAGRRHNRRPDPQRDSKTVTIEKLPQQKRTSGSYNILTRQNDSVRHRSMTVVKPLAER